MSFDPLADVASIMALRYQIRALSVKIVNEKWDRKFLSTSLFAGVLRCLSGSFDGNRHLARKCVTSLSSFACDGVPPLERQNAFQIDRLRGIVSRRASGPAGRPGRIGEKGSFAMSLLAKGKGEVTYKDLTSLHKWALVVLISMARPSSTRPCTLRMCSTIR